MGCIMALIARPWIGGSRLVCSRGSNTCGRVHCLEFRTPRNGRLAAGQLGPVVQAIASGKRAAQNGVSDSTSKRRKRIQ